MAHFAKLDENNIVLQVNVVSNNALDASNEEASGIAFLTELFDGYSNWKQTSYNGTFRKNFCGIGWHYDLSRDAFIPPKPFNSWILDEDKCIWNAPVEYPQDGNLYKWMEIDTSWVEVAL